MTCSIQGCFPHCGRRSGSDHFLRNTIQVKKVRVREAGLCVGLVDMFNSGGFPEYVRRPGVDQFNEIRLGVRV